MTTSDSHLKALLSPARCGTYFAPFRSRSANPDGFDSKMKHWVSAIEEWALLNKKLTFSLSSIHQAFVSDMNIRPDRECIRLVLSEMKRRSRIIPLNSLKNSQFWASSSTTPFIDNFIDPNSWLSWGMKRLVLSPASWALSTVSASQDQLYSDLTDLSIQDDMVFISKKALEIISSNLRSELTRVSMAEHRSCFEWPHLVELLEPILHTIIDAPDKKELLNRLELIIDYLALKKCIAVAQDADTKIVKLAVNNDTEDGEVKITKKDIANVRLLRAKELLTSDADRLHSQAMQARKDALENYQKQNIAKAKSLLRSHKRLTACAEQREAQLSNVENMIDQLECTESNMMIIQAYKDGAEALKVANTDFENMSTIMDDVYDATAENSCLQQTFNGMINDINNLSLPANLSMQDLEKELLDFTTEQNQSHALETTLNEQSIKNQAQKTAEQQPSTEKSDLNESVDSIIRKLDSVVINQNLPTDLFLHRESTPKKNPIKSVSES